MSKSVAGDFKYLTTHSSAPQNSFEAQRTRRQISCCPAGKFNRPEDSSAKAIKRSFRFAAFPANFIYTFLCALCDSSEQSEWVVKS